MSIKVIAEVIDIRSDIPKPSDRFFVDSNVWFWAGYGKSSSIANFEQNVAYTLYLGEVASVDAWLYRCGLSFPELAHSVERSEWEFFLETLSFQLSMKRFRHEYPLERSKVTVEIKTVWNFVKLFSKDHTISTQIDDKLIDDIISKIATQELDGYDLLMVNAMQEAGLSQVITDDADYAQVPDIQVFTANQSLIREAERQGKLRVR